MSPEDIDGVLKDGELLATVLQDKYKGIFNLTEREVKIFALAYLLGKQ